MIDFSLLSSDAEIMLIKTYGKHCLDEDMQFAIREALSKRDAFFSIASELVAPEA